MTEKSIPLTDSADVPKKRDLGNNAIVAGVVSALVAGAISFLVAHYQDESAVNQALATQRADFSSQILSQQEEAIRQLELAVSGLNLATNSTYQSITGCYIARHGVPGSWPKCVLNVPANPNYTTAEAAIGVDTSNISNTSIVKLAEAVENDSFAAIASALPNDATDSYVAMEKSYGELLALCGRILQGHEPR
jgi:hypothetical protein